MLKLIGAVASPYVRKVRVVMLEKKLDFEFITEDVWSDTTRIQDANPLGKVPCLVLEGGEAVFDSRVIVEYLDALSPVGKLIPTLPRERAAVKTWEALADGLLDASILARLERHWPHRQALERCNAWIDRQMSKVHQSLAAMSRALGENTLCSGIHLSLSDVAVGSALGYLDFRFPEIDWRSPHPNLHRLHDRLMQRPSFIETRPS
jgi:glutathione S-transferase